MARIEWVEDVEAWQKALGLNRTIWMTSAGRLARDLGFRDQLRRDAVSTRSDISVGFGRNGDRESRQWLTTAKGATGEVRVPLHVRSDVFLMASSGPFAQPHNKARRIRD
jgi:four helix bundle protein